MSWGRYRRWVRHAAPLLLVASVTWAAAVAFSGAASAAPYPPSGGTTISLSASIVAAGGTVRVQGSGFAASGKVSLDLHSAPVHLGSPATDPTGSFDTVVTIPASVTPGLHTLSATGADPSGQPVSASAQLTVLPPAATGGVSVLASRLVASAAGGGDAADAAAAPARVTANQVDALGPDAAGAPSGPLPHTGSGSEVALAIGAVIVVALGSAMVAVGRQRRPRRSR